MNTKEKLREKRFKTRSVAGTLALGETLAEMLRPPKLVILRGEVGAGKTTLVKGIARALGAAYEEDVTSPTFTLVHEYDGPKVHLFHLDLYRLETEEQIAVLLAPVSAPWLSVREVIDFVRAVRPQRVVPIHTAVLSDVGNALVDRLVAGMGGADYQRLAVGETIAVTR